MPGKFFFTRCKIHRLTLLITVKTGPDKPADRLLLSSLTSCCLIDFRARSFQNKLQGHFAELLSN